MSAAGTMEALDGAPAEPDGATPEIPWAQGPWKRPGPVRDRGAEPVDPAPLVAPSGWLAHPPTPWRRYAARSLDTVVNGISGFALLIIAVSAIAPAAADAFLSRLDSSGGRILDVLMSGAMASLIGGALIGVSGFTLGKLIFGVKVTRRDGGTLGLQAGLARDFAVLFKGLGLGLPLVPLVTMLIAYHRLTSSGATSWDRERYVVWHRPSGSAQYLLNVIGIILIISSIYLVGVLSRL
jgi:uncharacterized RDD family membrane protein YckC